MGSACGVCGKTSIENVIPVRPASPLQSFRVTPELLYRPAGEASRAPVHLRQDRRAPRGRPLLMLEGVLEEIREDIGRHNATDKVDRDLSAPGRAPLSDRILLVSGRAGFEIVQKAFAAGIPIVASVSAPSSLAVALAETGGVTLVGFLRERRFNVYANPERVASQGSRSTDLIKLRTKPPASFRAELTLLDKSGTEVLEYRSRRLKGAREGGPNGTHASRILESHHDRLHDRARFRRRQGPGRDARVQDLAHHGDPKYLSLLRGLLRRDHPHPRGQGEERRRPRSSTSKVIPTIRSAAARLCPKGITLKEDISNANRLTKPKVRKPGSDKWEDISWDEAIAKIARHIKTTRDKCFVAKNAKGQVVNRNPGMAIIGGCTDTNEFNFLQWKVISALGVPYRDSQARV